jgi:hypothetical protein
MLPDARASRMLSSLGEGLGAAMVAVIRLRKEMAMAENCILTNDDQ